MTKKINRKKGGGPKTEEGKKRSSLNAMKHGMTATAPHALEALGFQTGAEFKPILEKARTHFHPADPMEDEMVNRIARCMWRLARIQQMEDQLIEQNPYRLLPVNSATSLLKYERQADLHLHRAIRALASMRESAKSANQQNELCHAQPERESVSKQSFSQAKRTRVGRSQKQS